MHERVPDCHRVRRAIVLPEVIAAAVIGVVLMAVLFVAAKEGRRQSSLGTELANYRQIAAGTVAFGLDHDDRVWAFASTTPWHAAQEAWQIMQNRSGLGWWLGPAAPNDWFPHPYFSHLVLLDYLDTRLPEQFVISPEDHLRLLWARDPVGFESLPPDQRPPDNGYAYRRWPFSSSYQLTPAFWSQDASAMTTHQVIGGAHWSYRPGLLPLGGRRLSEVSFPGQKVMVHDAFQRHFGPRRLFYGYEEARVALMLADGSAGVRRTGDANRGFNPTQPTSPAFSRVNYTPAPWEPPTASGQAQQIVTTFYHFTRSGLRGRDFGGPDVPWPP